MPVRRGHVAPRTTIIETIIRKFDTHDRSFVVANAQQGLCHIIYCSDGFCRLTGYSRAEVMQRPAVCDFLHGPMTSPHAIAALRDALLAGVEKHFEILYYRKDETKFLCSEVIAPIRSEVDDICLQIINFEDLSAQPTPPPVVPTPTPINNRLSTRFDRARASFRAGLSRTGVVGSSRVRNRPRASSTVSPHCQISDGTILDEDANENCPLTCGSPTMIESWGSSRIGTPPPPAAPNQSAVLPLPTGTCISGGHVSSITTTRTNIGNSQNSQAPISTLEGASTKSGLWEGQNSPPVNEEPSGSVSHAASLDAISKRMIKSDMNRIPCRSLTCSVLAGRGSERVTGLDRWPATIDNIMEAAKHSKLFPGVASESDLQRWRTSRERKSPSLSQMGSDSVKHKFSLQDNGSAKFFQGVMHTPNMGEKVAQVLSLGADVLPEYKLQSPRVHKWTILHYSPFKAVWDWIILILVMYTAIFTPYVAAFLLGEPDYNNRKAKKYSDDPIVIIDLIVDVTFVVDILINFRTTFVNTNDEVVSGPWKIAVHYLKGWFIIDLVAAIPFDLLLYGYNTDETTTLMGLLKTARLLRLVRVARKIDRYSEYGAAVLLLLMATFALIAHWMACIWYAIGNAERPSLKSKVGWLDILANDTHQFYYHNNTGGPSIKSRYITALYFTFSSLTSVGFGNVAPNTDAEKIFTIIVMLIGSLMYASIFGNVSAIIQRLYSGTARYHTQMLRVREFIRFHQIPNPLRQRLEEYFQHAWTYTNGIDMNSVLKGFPECLQADICLHLNRQLLNNCKAFEKASPGCLRALSLKFKTTHAPPGDTLVHRGDVLTSLYFISRGSIEILKNDIVMAILNPPDIFGENPCEYSTVGKSSCNVRALTYCDLHKIHRDDLLDVLALYPEFHNHFIENLEITFNMRDEEQAGVDPISARFPPNTPTDVDGCDRKFAFRPPRYRYGPGNQSAPSTHLIPTGRQDSIQDDQDDYDKTSGHGILEFSTDKAGQDVTPLNLEFDEPKQRSSTLNSITEKKCVSLTKIVEPGCSGMLTHLKRSIPDLRQHKIHLQPLTSHDYLAKQVTTPLTRLPRRSSTNGESCTSHGIIQQVSNASSHYTTPPSPQLRQQLTHPNSHGDFQSGPGRPLDEINIRIDDLSKQVSSLERTMTGDIRLILALLQQSLETSKESSGLDILPGTAPAALITTTTTPTTTATRSIRPPALTQRSASEPQSSTLPVTTSTNGNNNKIQSSASHSIFRQTSRDPTSGSSGTSRLTLTSDTSALATALQSALNGTNRLAPTRSQSQPVELIVPQLASHYHHTHHHHLHHHQHQQQQQQQQPQLHAGWHSQPAAFRRGEFRSGYSSFNKRSEAETDDPWSSCAITVNETRSLDLRKEDSTSPQPQKMSPQPHNNNNNNISNNNNNNNNQLDGQRPEPTRQASDDISWEFTINEAPIARLESLDELDQDHDA
ncbi:potassium voltage-gated channel subfamily H member 7 isoform X3 [Aphidius gifuensis]|uniref:potassium voltage-gated channel subfamily H member 7 isoform X3 n=1 Tax=Aphidius gifuensis TaxID=684658 RepID=UPI001CDD4C88|nr:potassium voltage-gated channel subfamily H member 7 isoform X3 [Aphidius gifuensis]